MSVVEINLITGERTDHPYTSNELADIASQAPALTPVPKYITAAQCRLFLLQQGMLDTVEQLNKETI